VGEITLKDVLNHSVLLIEAVTCDSVPMILSGCSQVYISKLLIRRTVNLHKDTVSAHLDI